MCVFWTSEIVLTDHRLAMADLLASLEASLTQKGGASERLRALLSKVDEYMSSQRVQDTPSASTYQGTDNREDQPQQADWPMDFDASRGMELDPAFSFQLPQELLVDWPWPLDLTQGFGNL